MKPQITLISTFFLIVITACSTARVRVFPGEGGVHEVSSKDIEKDGAEEAAYKEARKFCEKRGQDMYLVKEEKTQYQGSMNEKDRNAIRNASKAAMILSGPVGYGTRSTGVGAVLGGAGTVGYSMTSDRDYESRFQFKCR